MKTAFLKTDPVDFVSDGTSIKNEDMTVQFSFTFLRYSLPFYR